MKAVNTNQARNALVSAYVDALSANESTGSLITHVCDVASKYFKGAEIPDDERKAIIADIAVARGWKGSAIKARGSECNVVLKAYAKLPEAIKALTAKVKRCQWHDSMKLARRINKGDSITQAVAFAAKPKAEGTSNPEGRVAGALKALWEQVPKKRKAVMEAAKLLHIELRGLN